MITLSFQATQSDKDAILLAVKKEKAMNMSDLVRTAVRNHCRDIGIVVESEKVKQVVFEGGN